MSNQRPISRTVDEKIHAATDDFIGARLPEWLKRASRAQIAGLRSAFTAHQASQARMRGLTLDLQPLQVFAEKHLTSLLAKPLPEGVTFSQLEWLVVTPWVGRLGSSDLQAFGYNSTRSVGIFRLMSNFEPASSFYAGSGLVAPGRDEVLSISATALASECRRLDAGQKYQQELDRVFNETTLAVMADDKRSGLALASKIAAMKGDVSAAVEIALLEMTNDEIHRQQAGLRAFGGALKVLGHVAADGMLIRLRDVQGTQVGILLYLPSDPHQALRYFDDEASMNIAISNLLQGESYRSFFSQLIALNARARFVDLLGKRLKDPSPDLELQGIVVQGSLFKSVANDQVKRTKDDARFLLVPTADADATAAHARHVAWKAAGLNLVNLAGLFIPAVGALLLGQQVMQILSDVFEGVHDWYEGHRHEALEHMLGVAETLAATAATVAGVSFVRSAVVAAMEPVNVTGGIQRLWRDSLVPYESVPEKIALRPDGLYGDGKRRWMRANSLYYEVYRPEPEGPFRLRHPWRSGAYEPAVLHNDQRCWRPINERPWEWDDSAQMLDRLWPQHPMIGTQRAEQVLCVAGVDRDELRGVLMENRKLPVNLHETLRRFAADERVERFFEHLRKKRFDEQDGELLTWCETQPDVGKGIDKVLQAEVQLRGKLYVHLSRLDKVGNDPLLKLLLRDFPGLGDAYAQHLVDDATTVELNEALRTGKIPQALALKAVSLLRTARVSRALAGLYLANAYSTETGELIFALLNQLGALTLNINLCEGEFDGRVIASVVAQERGTPLRVLVHQQGQFAVYASDGSTLANPAGGRGDLFDVIAAQLTPGQRTELGLNDNDPASQSLRARALEQLPEGHQAIAAFLEWPVRERWSNPGLRLEDGRVGYLLSNSGKGRPATAFEVLRNGLRRYFPGLSDTQLEDELQRRLAGQASAYDLLLAIQHDHEQLGRALQRWQGSEFNDGRRQLRDALAQRLRRAWAAQGELIPAANGRPAGQRLSLHDVGITALPEFAAQLEFTYVTSLVISDTMISDIPTQFLHAFSRLQVLSLIGNALLRIPAGLGQLTELRELRLARNNIRLDAASQQALTGLPNLTYLDLSRNPIGQLSMRFDHLPHMARLYLRDCRLGAWPTGLEFCGFLEVADLRDNQLRGAPPEVLQMPHEFRRALRLDGNRISGSDLARLYALDSIPEEPVATPRSATEIRSWWVGEEDAPSAGRAKQWRAVEVMGAGAELIALLGRMIEFADFSWPRSFLLEQGWNVLTEWESNAAFRQQIDVLMAQPILDDNAAIDRFSQVLLQLRVARLEDQVAVERGTELLALGRLLMRLDFLGQYANRDIVRRENLRAHIDRTAIVLGYRVRLRQQLQLPLQPRAMRNTPDGHISGEQLMGALHDLRQAETDQNLISSLCRRRFWQALVALEHADAFANLAELYAQRRNLLEEVRIVLGDSEYQRRTDALNDQESSDIDALRRELTLPLIRRLDQISRSRQG